MAIASILAALVPCALPTVEPARNLAPQPAASVDLFYDYLSRFGTWIEHPTHAWVWYPSDVESSWHPYLHGHWEYTVLHGWTWVSDHPWGWAPCHYGRWVFDAGLGWIWIPGTVWAPAWVAWGVGGGCIGWVPLPAGAEWDPQLGLQLWNVNLVGLGAPSWVFVEQQSLLHPEIAEVVLPTDQAAKVLRQTRLARKLEPVGGRVFAKGVDVAFVEQATGTKVLPSRAAEGAAEPRAQRGPETTPLFRPDVGRETAAPPPPPPREIERTQSVERSRLESDQAAERARLEKALRSANDPSLDHGTAERLRREQRDQLKRQQELQRAQMRRRQELARKQPAPL